MKKIKSTVESVVLRFDFSSELDGIDTAVVAVSIYGAGTDPDVASFLVGSPQISGTNVFHRIAGGRKGLKYQVRCTATRGSDVILRKDIIYID